MKLQFLCAFLLLHSSLSLVSLENIKLFFGATYDTDHNGYATREEFVEYFNRMEPDHQITIEDIEAVFDTFDTDNDNKVTLNELISLSQIKISFHAGHKQIHLGLTENDQEMQVMWVSQPQSYQQPVVHYGTMPSELKLRENAQITTYNVGHFGFHGQIYRAVMKNLQPLKKYYYRVGDERTQTFSEIKYFKAPPSKVQQLDKIRFAVFGDMGTFAPFGHMVAKQISYDNFRKPLDFVFLTGDIAYAGMNSEKVGEFEPIWDLFGEITENFAAYCAFMPGVGNHEKYYNYTSYMNRYVLPRNYPGQTNLWFSFDYGQVHIVHFSSEHPYNKGSEQYRFLEDDLKKARGSPLTKWIIVGVHRAFYSSDSNEYANVTNLAFHLEELVDTYKVDIVQTGHLHDYERSWPTIKGKSFKAGQNETHFVNPVAPIYVVQGTAGALIREKFITPSPEWSLKRILRYGYGRITIVANTLTYEFIGAPTGKILDRWSITKT